MALNVKEGPVITNPALTPPAPIPTPTCMMSSRTTFHTCRILFKSVNRRPLRAKSLTKEKGASAISVRNSYLGVPPARALATLVRGQAYLAWLQRSSDNKRVGAAYLAWLLTQEVVVLLQQHGESGGSMVVLHGGQVIVADLMTGEGARHTSGVGMSQLKDVGGSIWWFSMGDKSL